MTQQPQRPFVPHRTPTAGRSTITTSEFRLYRPFVPGAEREVVESNGPMRAAGFVASEPERIRPIEDFLDTSVATPRAYAQERKEVASETDSPDVSDELPPVEHFLDPLPEVEHFAPDPGGALSEAWPAESGNAAAAGPGAGDPAESGWIETD